jgi:hypothetical protein
VGPEYIPLTGTQLVFAWLLIALLIALLSGEIATWAAPRHTRPWHLGVIAMLVTGTLMLWPLLTLSLG